MESLFYWYKPYIFYTLGFVCTGLDHPVKWISVILFFLASLYISFSRYQNQGAASVRRIQYR